MGTKRTLIVGPSWVGDMVMAQSLFQAIHAQTAEGVSREITVLAPKWSQPVLDRMDEVHRVEVMPIGHGQLKLAERYRLGRRLMGMAFDQAIILPGSLKSALVPWFARIPKRTGFVGEQRFGLINDIRSLDPGQLPLNVQRYVSLAFDKECDLKHPSIQSPTFPALNIDFQSQKAALDKLGLPSDTPVLGLCPGAEYGPAKQWPAQHFAEVALARIAQGWQVWIFGSEKDRSIADEICHLTDQKCRNLTGKTGLGEAIDLLALCQWVVTNDSGLMHVAAALGVQVVAIYGSSTDQFTPPLTHRCHRLALDMDCRPCFQRHCPLGHTDCLVKLSPQKVIPLLHNG